MTGDLFDSPWKILVVAVVLIVLFGSAKLPGAARSLGRSMRILKAEVHDLHGEDTEPESATPAPAAEQQVPAAPQQITTQQQLVAQQQVDDLQRQLADLKKPATRQPAAHRMQQPG
jgi:sec-independent protein translocase protein TatA